MLHHLWRSVYVRLNTKHLWSQSFTWQRDEKHVEMTDKLDGCLVECINKRTTDSQSKYFL